VPNISRKKELMVQRMEETGKIEKELLERKFESLNKQSHDIFDDKLMRYCDNLNNLFNGSSRFRS
jgi:hypothetical protein